LRSINTEFGLDSKSDYANELLAELNRFLLAETAAGRTVVLVIDEARTLSGCAGAGATDLKPGNGK